MVLGQARHDLHEGVQYFVLVHEAQNKVFDVLRRIDPVDKLWNKECSLYHIVDGGWLVCKVLHFFLLLHDPMGVMRDYFIDIKAECGSCSDFRESALAKIHSF